MLGRASVIGLEFWEGAVGELSSDLDAGAVHEALQRLVRKDLLRPTRSELLGEEAFRFRHILIRDAAYDSLLKETRAELHERFANWLQDALGERAGEVEEILGYHFERAYRFRSELEPAESWQELATTAGEHLAAAGERALLRSDMPAASALLSRALDLLLDDWLPRGDLILDLGSSFRQQGDWARANECLKDARQLANQNLALSARLEAHEALLRFDAEPEFTVKELLSKSTHALDELISSGHEIPAARVRMNVAWAYVLRGQMEAAEKILNEVEPVAQRDVRLKNLAREQLLPAVWLYGPLPVKHAKRRCEVLLSTQPALRVAASCYRSLAVLEAMVGNFNEARGLLNRDRELLDELGLPVIAAATPLVQGAIELLAGNPAAAEQAFRIGVERLKVFGETMYSAEIASLLARALCMQKKYDAAWRVSESLRVGRDRDVSAPVFLYGTRARLLASRGYGLRGTRLAQRAVRLAETTDMLDLRGDSLLDLSEVLRLECKHAEARSAAKEALQLYEQKGNLVSAARARAALEESGAREVPV